MPKTALELRNAPVNISKFYAREIRKSARENVQKSTRECENVPVKIFQKIRFTGTFEVHGKKNLSQRERN